MRRSATIGVGPARTRCDKTLSFVFLAKKVKIEAVFADEERDVRGAGQSLWTVEYRSFFQIIGDIAISIQAFTPDASRSASRSDGIISGLIKRWTTIDPTALVIALSLCGIGLVYLSSAAPSTSFVVRQAVFLFAGLVAFSAMYTVHYSNWTRYAWVLYAAGIASLIAVAIVGTRVNGAKSWFSIGSIRIQPSEFMKIATLLFLARHLSIGDGAKKFSGLLAASALVGVPMLMITVQPDFGSALAFVPMAAGAVWIAGVKKRYVAAALLIGLLTASFGYAFLLKDYQKQRIEAWLNPDAYSKTTAYQTAQARIAIGSGRLSGKGLNQGTHHKLKYLPERHTDMIFAVVSEEGGFVMSGLTLSLFFALFLYGILTAYRTRDPAGRMIAVLASSLLTGQAIINIGVCNGLVPVTGIALPFLSYGGSSLLSSWMAVGLLANVASRRKVWLGADGVSG